ncbi:MAG: M23 family metallopeptidase [Elusimicrobia bacterium]|nr:M23 family metallopeptidase [Elusimicrobiota bacterium]
MTERSLTAAWLGLILAFPAPARAAVADENAFQALSAVWKQKNWETLYALFAPSYQKYISSPDLIRLFQSIPIPIRVLKRQALPHNAGMRFHYLDEANVMSLALHADDDGRIDFLMVTMGDGAVPYPTTHEEDSPQPLAFPFSEGSWQVAGGAHHRASRAQRFAADLVMVRDGRSSSGDPKTLGSYFAYSQPILCPTRGTVAEVLDGRPEAAPHPDAANPAGNRVVLKLEDGHYLLLAHLRPGSVAVSEGQTVNPGDLVGRVGSSGNSSEPHLHIQISNGFPWENAEALPFCFQKVMLNGSRADCARPEPNVQLELPPKGMSP